MFTSFTVTKDYWSGGNKFIKIMAYFWVRSNSRCAITIRFLFILKLAVELLAVSTWVNTVTVTLTCTKWHIVQCHLDVRNVKNIEHVIVTTSCQICIPFFHYSFDKCHSCSLLFSFSCFFLLVSSLSWNVYVEEPINRLGKNNNNIITIRPLAICYHYIIIQGCLSHSLLCLSGLFKFLKIVYCRFKSRVKDQCFSIVLLCHVILLLKMIYHTWILLNEHTHTIYKQHCFNIIT